MESKFKDNLISFLKQQIINSLFASSEISDKGCFMAGVYEGEVEAYLQIIEYISENERKK